MSGYYTIIGMLAQEKIDREPSKSLKLPGSLDYLVDLGDPGGFDGSEENKLVDAPKRQMI